MGRHGLRGCGEDFEVEMQLLTPATPTSCLTFTDHTGRNHDHGLGKRSVRQVAQNL